MIKMRIQSTDTSYKISNVTYIEPCQYVVKRTFTYPTHSSSFYSYCPPSQSQIPYVCPLFNFLLQIKNTKKILKNTLVNVLCTSWMLTQPRMTQSAAGILLGCSRHPAQGLGYSTTLATHNMGPGCFFLVLETCLIITGHGTYTSSGQLQRPKIHSQLPMSSAGA